MPVNKVLYDSGIYTNLQGTGALAHEYKNNKTAVKTEISQQFESLLVQMLLKSMRDTNKAFASELMTNDQSEFYNDMYDKQLALLLSKSGMGIAKNIENYIDKHGTQTFATPTSQTGDFQSANHLRRQANVDSPALSVNKTVSKHPSSGFENAADFVKNLWESARLAAKILGTDPKILLAQAALETNWGKNIMTHEGNKSTNNLFNIKADSRWSKASATIHAIEEKDGVLVKEKSKFRVYDSYDDSFMDYTNFLQQNSRYRDALDNAHDPRKFVNALQSAQYATDSSYSDKIMDIYSSKKFNTLIEQNRVC